MSQQDPTPLRPYGKSPLGTTIFTVARSLDVVLQFYLLKRGLGARILHSFGTSAITDTATNAPVTSVYTSVLWAFAIGSATKQLLWLHQTSLEAFPPVLASGVAVYNTLLNTANALLALWTFSSNCPQTVAFPGILRSSPTFCLAVGMYGVGIVSEYVSELQRMRFKKHPKNKGRPYGDGLFGLATNINYGSYTIWRSGYSMAAAGLPAGILQFAMLFGDFAGRAVPEMEAYCARKYGAEWQTIRERVKFRLIPGIY